MVLPTTKKRCNVPVGVHCFHDLLKINSLEFGMYQDQESIKVFEQMHARDQAVQLARKLRCSDRSSDDLDIFASHASGEAHDGLISNIFCAVIALAVLVGSIALLLR